MRAVEAEPTMQAAMFAMLAAFGAEVATRQPVFVQIQKAPLAILATFVTIITASVNLKPWTDADPGTMHSSFCSIIRDSVEWRPCHTVRLCV